MKSRPVSISGVNGLTFATVFTQPDEQGERHVDRREEQHEEHRHLHQRPGLHRAQAHRHARRPQRRARRHEQREHHQPDEVDAVAADLHAGEQRDDEQQHADERRRATSAASA